MTDKFAKRMENMNGTATREIFKLLARPEIISFAGGNPALECLPTERVKGIIADLTQTEGFTNLLQYGLTAGLPQLRQLFCEYVKTAGINDATVDNVLVISGGQQGIDLVLKTFIDAGDVILVENPTYLAFLQLANSYEGKCVGVDADSEGLILADLEAKIIKHNPKILYCVPTFSNPTGKTYSVENRKKIAELTAKYGVIVIEDDPYSKLRFAGETLPSIKSFDTTGNVIFLSSFSKIISPGNRTGVACGDAKIIKKMEVGKQGTDLHTPNISQMITYEYLSRGYLDIDIQKSVKIYGHKKEMMCNAIDKYMPKEFKYVEPEGGLFIWGEFPDYINVKEIFPEATALNVAYISGNVFFADESGTNCIRLNYSYANDEQIKKGMKILGELFTKHINKHKQEQQ